MWHRKFDTFSCSLTSLTQYITGHEIYKLSRKTCAGHTCAASNETAVHEMFTMKTKVSFAFLPVTRFAYMLYLTKLRLKIKYIIGFNVLSFLHLHAVLWVDLDNRMTWPDSVSARHMHLIRLDLVTRYFLRRTVSDITVVWNMKIGTSQTIQSKHPKMAAERQFLGSVKVKKRKRIRRMEKYMW